MYLLKFLIKWLEK